MTPAFIHHPSSYRDPSGFIFEKDGIIYRQVNHTFREHYDHFVESGCYKHLIERGLLIQHEDLKRNITGDADCYTTLQPEKIHFISYPYEWSFDMLRDAALLTLQLIRETLSFDIILKDATPYNVQWHRSRLTFIDTLSFEKYQETTWIAYRQFCEHFLGPLLLMHYSKKSLQQLLLAWPEGIPLDIVHKLLPRKTRFSVHIYLHIHLHAKLSGRKNKQETTRQELSRPRFLRLLSSLETLITRLHLPDAASTWSGYYQHQEQEIYLQQKGKMIGDWIANLSSVRTAIDLGANEGKFSQLLTEKGIEVIAADFDPYCINRLYKNIRKNGIRNIQPLVADLSNPSPAIGVNNRERDALIDRTQADLVFALALVHHLVISKNIPFSMITELFRQIADILIIEFVPREDEKVRFMMAQKPGNYDHYTQVNFENSISRYFITEKKEMIGESGRVLYLLRKK